MIKIWNFETKQCKVSLNGHKSSVSCLSFNSSSSVLVSGSLDTHLVVWDLLAERGVARLKGHKTRITQCAIVESSERGNFVISSSLDGMLKVWNLEIYQVCSFFFFSKIDLMILNLHLSAPKLLLVTEEKFGILWLTKSSSSSTPALTLVASLFTMFFQPQSLLRLLRLKHLQRMTCFS